ncbi:hypothetical protein GM3708_2750 [Geminocystis sp. NIES-3708]|uniref:hypothetical protein n=1 Tax=Geminocystis sp. NIES-3708 TaxID=1615909 RepID=UPI0005FC4294|nr:hypothetical protein [Geminocystis sp. NIES-3708]BAQ62344.1 hypothetical protein GM3708_2750 [Geminocystis sp. NIES-3708]
MINTAIGNNIDYQTLKKAFYEAINNKLTFDFSLQIDCFKENNYLVILISDVDENILIEIINQIKEVINSYQIIDDFLICNFDNTDNVYFNSQENNDVINQNELLLKAGKKYISANFSVSFILLILGIISLGTIGIFYYFTRPCVIGNCELITTTETSISSSFKNQSQDLTETKIKELQLSLINGINDLKRIPFWSKSYDNANLLIKDYQNQVEQLDNLLVALKSVDTAETVSKNLPLSLDEWNRVKDFFNEAITIINQINIEELDSYKQKKINIYNNKLQLIDQNISQEKQGNELLSKGKTIATDIENQQTQVTNLSELENLQKNWQLAIKTIESIPEQTNAYREKDATLKNYLQKLIEVQNKINEEKDALNIKKEAEEKIKLAKESQKNNQWTKAVSLWQEAISLLKKVPSEVLAKKEITDLESSASKQLIMAKSELKQAVTREEIKQELIKICKNTEEICTFNVSKESVKVFLTDKYLQKIASLSAVTKLTNNIEQEKQISTHINQVEKNYKYINAKYKIPVEVYNPQRQLIMIYSKPI